MSDVDAIPTWSDGGTFHVVVETPAGSRLKYVYDPKLRHFTVSRPLALGLSFPYDFGFVPNTRAEDGDPIDAMVLSCIPSYPGVVYACRALGVLRLTQKKKSAGREWNDRIIAVPVYDAELADEAIDDRLDQRRKHELSRFFLNAGLFEDKRIRIDGWDGPRAARKLIARHGGSAQ
jgi:inorganic pyrophosphatase